jgi:hypothetical protein
MRAMTINHKRHVIFLQLLAVFTDAFAGFNPYSFINELAKPLKSIDPN